MDDLSDDHRARLNYVHSLRQRASQRLGSVAGGPVGGDRKEESSTPALSRACAPMWRRNGLRACAHLAPTEPDNDGASNADIWDSIEADVALLHNLERETLASIQQSSFATQ